MQIFHNLCCPDTLYRVCNEIWHPPRAKNSDQWAWRQRFPPLGGSWPFLKHKIYSKKKDRFPDYTYVFEPTFSDIYVTDWFYFSDIFSVFAGLTGFISGFLNFLYYFIFPLYFTVTCIKTWVDSYFYRLFIGSFSTNGYVSQREAPDNILISWPIRSWQKYESYMQVTVKYNGKIKK